MTAHTDHRADLILLDCPRCLAQWEVIRATQADPLTVLDPLVPVTGRERRMPIELLVLTAAVVAVVAIVLWSDRRAPR